MSSAATSPFFSCTGTTDLTTPTRAPPIRTSLRFDQGVGVGHPRLQVVGGDEGQAVVGVVGEEDGDDDHQHGHRADQHRAAANPPIPPRFLMAQEVVEERFGAFGAPWLRRARLAPSPPPRCAGRFGRAARCRGRLGARFGAAVRGGAAGRFAHLRLKQLDQRVGAPRFRRFAGVGPLKLASHPTVPAGSAS